MSRATLKKISKEAGVSPSTASRVLNNYTSGFSVKPEIRKRILELAEKKNYRPSPIIKTMQAKKTMIVAFIHFGGHTHFSTGVSGEALYSAYETLANAGYQVSMNLLNVPEPERYIPQFPVDGLIISDVTDPAKLYRLEELDIPYVSLNGLCGPKGVSVQADDVQCMQDIFEHLRMLGHEKIAYGIALDGPWQNKYMAHPSVFARASTYESLMLEDGLTPHILECGDKQVRGQQILAYVKKHKASALILYDHFFAHQVLREAYLDGIKIPSDLSLVAFNDNPYTELSVPSLSCAAIPAERMGKMAAEILLRQMRDGEQFNGREFLLAGTLMPRESSAPLVK